MERSIARISQSKMQRDRSPCVLIHPKYFCFAGVKTFVNWFARLQTLLVRSLTITSQLDVLSLVYALLSSTLATIVGFSHLVVLDRIA